jgi:hypothetical protein
MSHGTTVRCYVYIVRHEITMAYVSFVVQLDYGAYDRTFVHLVRITCVSLRRLY